MSKKIGVLLLFVLCIVGLPLIAHVRNGESILLFLYFPPLAKPMAHPPFSWPVFLLLLLVAAIVVFGSMFLTVNRGKANFHREVLVRSPFPWWGWAGVVVMLVFWLLSWTRFGWCDLFQRYLFFPLWLAYIVSVNGLCFWQTGRCPLVNTPRLFFILFPTSTVFWWNFEYLNQFVGNWYYTGIDKDPVVYSLYASLAFSTVLPAVFTTQQLLKDMAFLRLWFGHGDVAVDTPPKLFLWLSLALGGGGLILMSWLPDELFFLLWVSPFLLLLGLWGGVGEKNSLYSIVNGDRLPCISAMLAGLICGVFWEMWNYFSLAKWMYSIPYVHGFQIFEMPLLGYLGYLPFGLTCLIVWEIVQSLLNTAESEIIQ